MKYLLFLLLLLCPVAFAQSFSQLLTDSNDYTCGGVLPCATWPIPPIPSPGSSYIDPTWKTTTWRLATPAANTGTVTSTYSRVQAWNSDNTKMFALELGTTCCFIDLYDATTTPPTPINRINVTDVQFGLDAGSNDALWSFTDPSRIYFIPWRASGHGLELRYIDVSSCTATSCNLTSTIVHTFACSTDSTDTLGAGVAGDKIETGTGAQGGMFDSTDRYFSFTCDKVATDGRHEIDIIRYDKLTDTVPTQEKWYNLCPGAVPSGCHTYSVFGKPVNMIRMNQHPDQRFITVIWQTGCRDVNWTRGCGTEVFDSSYNFIGYASAYDGHQDNGFDINGVPVLVTVGSFRNDTLDERAVEIATLSTTSITRKRVIFPCSFSRQPTCTGIFLGEKGSHVSMTGTWGKVPGYALYSTMMGAGSSLGLQPNYPVGSTCLVCGDTGFGAMELFAVKIDTTVLDGSPAQTWRIGRTMAVRDNNYNAEPHAAVNRDWTQILWGSTWNVDPLASGTVYGFWTKLATPAKTFTLTCPTTITQGVAFSCTVN